jgi:signal transduction histidine kinase
MTADKIRFHAMVHDLKNPIGLLLANLALLADETYGPLNEKQQNLVERSLRGVRNVQAVVKNILELGRSEAGPLNYRDFRLATLVTEVMCEVVDIDHQPLQNKAGAGVLKALQNQVRPQGVEIIIDEHLWAQKVVSDFGKLKQILANLVSNAIKYKCRQVEVLITSGDGYLEFSIKDDGPGIPPVYHDQIFESYFQMQNSFEASVRGHGIGLAAVAVLVKDLNGKLDLVSTQGEGADFIVRIPINTNLKVDDDGV